MEVFSTTRENLYSVILCNITMDSLLLRKKDYSNILVIMEYYWWMEGGEMTKKDCPRNYQSIT